MLPSCPAQQCGWLQTAFQLGVFSSYKCFLTPCLCLPRHSAAPCTFALVYFTPEHFGGGLWGRPQKGVRALGVLGMERGDVEYSQHKDVLCQTQQSEQEGTKKF